MANYYLDRRAYIAALRRGQYVVENFQGTPAVADGVAIMVESYLRLGLNELADTSLALLKENYPDHISIDDEGDFRSGRKLPTLHCSIRSVSDYSETTGKSSACPDPASRDLGQPANHQFPAKSAIKRAIISKHHHLRTAKLKQRYISA